MLRHVVIATSAHPWDDVRVKAKFADSFLQHGAAVTWIGQDKKSFLGSVRDPRIRYELRDGLNGYAKRLGLIPWIVRRVRALEDVDCVYVPDPDLAPMARVLRGRGGARVVYDIHEEFHRGPIRNALGGRTVPLAERGVLELVRKGSAASDLTISVSDSLLRLYASPRQNRLAVPNTAHPLFLSPISEKPARPLRIFHGKATVAHGTPVVLEALESLSSSVDVRIMFFPGPGSSEGLPYDPAIRSKLCNSLSRNRVDLRDAVALKYMPSVMDECHVGMIAYGRQLGVASLPNRLFEYMARGLAVFAPEYARDTADVLRKHRCGITLDFESPSAVAEAMKWAYSNADAVREMGLRGRAAIEKHYSWNGFFTQVLGALEAPPFNTNPRS